MNTMIVKVDRWYSTVDWITATCENDRPASQQAKFGMAGYGYLKAYHANQEAKPWSFMGFHGWKAGQLCWGGSMERAIIRAYGEASNMSWRMAGANATNVSRLDLAVTFHPRDRGNDLARLIAEVILSNRDKGSVRKDKKLALIEGFGAGDTLYIGSRKSQTFCRVYDKAAQSQSPENKGLWRVELELKDDRAKAVMGALQKSSNAEGLIASLTTSFMYDHGIRLEIGAGNYTPLPPTYKARDPRIEATLRWLGASVRPAIIKAIAAVGESEVMAVLGLTGKEE